MSIYEKNLEAIRDRDPDLYDAILEKNLGQGEIEYYLDSARNGEMILGARQDGKIQFMSSRYDPGREASHFVKQYDKVLDYSFMIFFGFGNGVIARKLLQSRDEHVMFLFYEPSPQMFLLVLEHCDLTTLFCCSRVRIVIRDLNDERIDFDIIAGITDENYQICTYDALPVYRQMFPREEKEMERKYRYHVENKIAQINLYASVEKKLVYNDIYNMRNLLYCNCEEEFKGIFPVDRPAIIVAAGPSLEKNVQDLRAAKGYFLIIAVDSALPYLIAQNVRPDLVIVVDAEKPVQLFENLKSCQIPLAVATDVNYEILELTKEKIIYISSQSGCYNKIFQLSGRTMYHLPTGGSVATSAFGLVVAWGYRKIVLVGQDLALTTDKVHAGEADRILPRSDAVRIEVDGYYGDKVYTTWDFNHYKEWYEMALRANDTLEVINATEGGVRIKGSIQMSLKEVVESYKAEPFDFEKAIRDMPPTFSARQKEDILNLWRDSVTNLDVLKERLSDGIDQAEEGIRLIRNKQYSESRIVELQKNLSQITQECDAMDEIYFLHEMAAKAEANVLGDIHVAREDAAEEVCRIFEKISKYMKAMRAPVDEVKAMYEKIILDVQGKD